MASLNKVLLIGNLSADPELRQTASHKDVCNFSIAVNRPFAKEGQTNVDFMNIVAWGGTALFVTKYFKKGDPIFVMGRFENRKWTDEDGNTRYATDIIADELSFVRSKGNGADPAPEAVGNENFQA